MNYRVVLREELHQKLVDYLLRHFQVGSLQEEVCFALWYPGDGMNRYTGILHELILPISDDRELHGNITVHLQYLNRVLERALDMNAGVAVLHSHPDCGWQTLSCDDEDTERNLILPFIRETGLPLLGLTLAKNEIWSARFWHEPRLGSAQLTHCTEVRRVGVRKSVCRYSIYRISGLYSTDCSRAHFRLLGSFGASPPRTYTHLCCRCWERGCYGS